MRSTLMKAALGAAFLCGGAQYAHAQCATGAAPSATGVIFSGPNNCTADGRDDVAPRLACGKILTAWSGGKDIQMRWTAPETGIYRFTNTGSENEAVVTVTSDGSASCTSANSRDLLGCGFGAVAETGTISLARGETVLVTYDPRRDTCGAYSVTSTLVRGCVTGAHHLGSAVGQKVIALASTAGESTVLPTSCGNGAFGVGATHGDRVYSWIAPETGRYVFRAESHSGGVTIAAFEDDCHGAELACANSGLAAAQESQRAIAIDATAGKGYTILVRGREGSIVFDLSIGKDGCLYEEDLGSALGSDLLTETITQSNRQVAIAESCNSGTGGQHLYAWTAPYTGWYSFRTDANAGDGRVGIDVRKGTCQGESLGCHTPSVSTAQAKVRDVYLDQGEQVAVVMNAHGSVVGHRYTLSIYGMGCGDGVVGQNSSAGEFGAGPKAGVDGEICEPQAPVTITCDSEFATGSFGPIACAESCGEWNTDACARACPATVECDTRSNSVSGCNAGDECMYQCGEGFLDCNGDLHAAQGETSDGCEIDETQPMNCGACGQICGSTQTCELGAVGYACVGTTLCFPDGDLDGYATDDAVGVSTDGNCPAGTTPLQGDCDDTNAQIHPNAGELCNGIDDNCSGEIDETSSTDPICAAGPGAVGACQADENGAAQCTYTCAKDRQDTDGDIANGCEKTNTPTGPGPEDPGDGGPGDGGDPGELPDGMVFAGGRVWGGCAATGLSSQGAWISALILVGLALIRRRRVA